MIAVLSIIYTSSTGSLKLFIVLNIAFYLLSLLLILRVIWVPEFLEDQIEQRKVILTKELLFSRKYMRSAHLIVTVLTPLIVTIFIISAWQATGDKIASFPITPK
jgi:hypothetical protein